MKQRTTVDASSGAGHVADCNMADAGPDLGRRILSRGFFAGVQGESQCPSETRETVPPVTQQRVPLVNVDM